MSNFTVAGKSVQDPHVNSALTKIFSDPRLKTLHNGDKDLTGTELYSVLQAYKITKNQLSGKELKALNQVFRRRFPRLKHLHSKIWIDPALENVSSHIRPAQSLLGSSHLRTSRAKPDPTEKITRNGICISLGVTLPLGETNLGNGLVLQRSKEIFKPGVFINVIRHKNFRYNLVYMYTKAGRVIEIGTNYGKATTNVATSASKHPAVKRIRTILGIKATPTRADRVYHRHQVQHEGKAVILEKTAKRLRSRLRQTPGAKLKRHSYHRFSPRDSIPVLQREVATASSSKKGWLLSAGAGPCVIVTLWDPMSKRGYLAHVDALTLKSSVNSTIGKFVSGISDPRKIQVRMFAGTGDSKTVHKIYQSLSARGLSGNIVEADLGNGVNSVALNLKTGRVYKIDGTALNGFPKVSAKLRLFSMTGMMKGPLTVVRDRRPTNAVQKPVRRRTPIPTPTTPQR